MFMGGVHLRVTGEGVEDYVKELSSRTERDATSTEIKAFKMRGNVNQSGIT